MIGLVVVVLVVGPALGSSWSESFYRAMAVLVAASPCALAIATPSAVLAAVARAGQLGVLVKGGGPLENLGTLRAMAFDKTGTLTEGRPRLTDVAPAAGVTESELLSIAVAVESRSDHPLAAAIVRDGADRLDGTTPPAVSDVSAVTGRGVRATRRWSSGVDRQRRPLRRHRRRRTRRRGHRSESLQAAGRTIMIVKHGDRFLGSARPDGHPQTRSP